MTLVHTDPVPAAAPQRTVRFEEATAVVAALGSADELGILRVLDDAPVPADRVASELGLDQRMTSLLLDVLDIGGVVEIDAVGNYRRVLTSDRLALHERLWNGLSDAVRSGRPAFDVTDPAVASKGYSQVVQDISRLVQPSLGEVVTALSPFGPRILDLGAGAAPWSRAIAASGGDVEVVAVDLPEVLEVTRRVVAEDGLSDRFSFVPGDLFIVDVDGEFDLVIVAGVCRLFSSDDNARLARRFASFVRPGGAIAILEALPDVDRADGRRIGLYALSLSLRTSGGAVHPFSSYATWLYAAGFAGIDLTILPTPEVSLIRATRPL